MEEEVRLERTGAIVCLDLDVDVGLDAEVFWLLGHRVWGKKEKAKAKTLGHGHGATGIGTRWQTIVYCHCHGVMFRLGVLRGEM